MGSLYQARVHALYLSSRDPRTPWYAKAVAIIVAAYALSPIDLIPDFIPVVGYLDDLVLVPLGILLAVRLVPGEVMAEHRLAAELREKPVSRAVAAIIFGVWIVVLALISIWAWHRFR